MSSTDVEIDVAIEYKGPSISFSHIESNNIGLYPYQTEIKNKLYSLWDTNDNVLIQMPTGTGKTIVFASIVNDIYQWCKCNSPESKILIVAHRKELIVQASKKLGDLPHGIIQSSTKQDLSKPIQVASIQTFMSNRNYPVVSELPFDFIIIDEAHHSIASGYQKLWVTYPKSKKLGVTATPWRMNHSGFTSLYSELITSKPIEWFINNGYLSPHDYISIRQESNTQQLINNINRFGVDGDYLDEDLSQKFDVPKIRAELLKSYLSYAKGKKGIIYAIDRQHARNIKELYSNNGIPIDLIDGTTPDAEREQIIQEFKNGVIQVIVNVNIFSEGFDCPDIEFVQLARPTRSLSMYLQQIGRALRVSNSKEKSVILDNVGLYNRFGTPMANRQWKRHFEGTSHRGEVGFNDGTLSNVASMPSERIVDYSEDDEAMSLVEYADGKNQIRDSKSDNVESTILDYNLFCKNGFWGVRSKSKRIIIQPIYEELRPYYKGFIPYKINGLWGILNSKGVVVVQAKYYSIGPFINGKALVQELPDSEPFEIVFYNGELRKNG